MLQVLLMNQGITFRQRKISRPRNFYKKITSIRLQRIKKKMIAQKNREKMYKEELRLLKIKTDRLNKNNSQNFKFRMKFIWLYLKNDSSRTLNKWESPRYSSSPIMNLNYWKELNNWMCRMMYSKMNIIHTWLSI